MAHSIEAAQPVAGERELPGGKSKTKKRALTNVSAPSLGESISSENQPVPGLPMNQRLW